MSNNQELSIKGTVSLEDFLTYNTYHSKKMVRRYSIFCFVILLAIAVLQELPLPGELLVVILDFITKGILSLILTFVIFLALKKLQTRRVIKEYESDQLIKNEARYTFTSEGITQQIRRSTNYFDWRDIDLALEREEMFLLYLSKQKAMVLPKSFFNSEDEIDLFKTIISTNIETSKIKFN